MSGGELVESIRKRKIQVCYVSEEVAPSVVLETFLKYVSAITWSNGIMNVDQDSDTNYKLFKEKVVGQIYGNYQLKSIVDLT